MQTQPIRCRRVTLRGVGHAVLRVLLAMACWAAPVAAILTMEAVQDRAQEARRHLGAVRVQLQHQETLQLHAVLADSHRTAILAELTESRATVHRLMANADALGLDDNRADDLRRLLTEYGEDIDRDVRTLEPGHHDTPDRTEAPGHADERPHGDTAHGRAHELFHEIDDQLIAADLLLANRVNLVGHATNVGIALIVLLALAITVLLTRRHRIAEVRRLSERQAESRYQALVTKSSDLVLVVGASGQLIYASPSAHRALSLPAGAEAAYVLDVVHPEDRNAMRALLDPPAAPAGTAIDARVECRFPRAEGDWGVYEMSIADLRTDRRVGGLVLTARDVTEQRQLRGQIEYQALHDALTGLPNRRLLFDRLEQALARADRTHANTGLIYLDLDGFKTINDSLGHGAGDDVLEEVGRRIRAAVRVADTVCRLGGDEFAVLLEDVDIDQARQAAERLLAAIGTNLQVGGRPMGIAASVGIALTRDAEHPDHPPLTSDELISAADMAMYAAKRSRTGIAVYHKDMYDAMLRRIGLERDLHQALARNEIHVAYQPIVAITDDGEGPIRGVEALMRWDSATWGVVSPAEFIPIAEDTGLIIPLGAYILRTAASTVSRWNSGRRAMDPLELAVNVSVRQIQQDGFIDTVEQVLREARLSPELLTLEVTESLLLAEDRAPVLARLRGLGVRIALDDFGTGYAALGHLNTFSVDQLKIDISFVRALGEEGPKNKLTASILALAASLGLDAVAEGVESADQLHRLQAMGCPHAQGYLFSKPMREEELANLLIPTEPELAAAARP